VEILDRVFDGDDVFAAVAVDVVQHGGQGSCLAAAGRAGAEDEPALHEGDGAVAVPGVEAEKERLGVIGDSQSDVGVFEADEGISPVAAPAVDRDGEIAPAALDVDRAAGDLAQGYGG